MNYSSLQFFIASGLKKAGLVLVAGTLILVNGNLAHAAVEDSTGVEINNGKLIIIHKVDPKETLFSISRKYNVPIADIRTANPALEGGLNIGQLIKVPTNRSAVTAAGPATSLAVPATKPATHIVEPQQTLYGISVMYKVTIDELKAWNSLSGNDISIGQELIVAAPTASKPVSQPASVSSQATVATTTTATPPATAAVKPATQPAPQQSTSVQEPVKTTQPQAVSTAPATPKFHKVEPSQTLFTIAQLYNLSLDNLKKWNGLATNDLSVGQELALSEEAAKQLPSTAQLAFAHHTASEPARPVKPGSTVVNITGYDKVVETGLAEVIESNVETTKYMALHKTAPVGTILQVKNDMNGTSVFVRVIGKLPDTGVNDKIIVRISKKAFERLNPIEKRFPVEVSYIP